MPARVTVTTPLGTSEFVIPDATELWLGRGGDNDLIVEETSVSRRHCTLFLRGESLVVTDRGSAHGLVLARQRVAECTLRPGEPVRIGNTELRFVARTPEPAATQPTATTTADPLLGRSLGGYRLLEVLGAGGFATVYRAEQTQLAREVAVKVLRAPPGGAEPHAVEGFLREARAAAALADPRLVQVFDFGHDRGLYFLSMEIVRGGSLARRVRSGGPVPWPELLRVLADVAGALAVAHVAGLVHRDVKPANILLVGDGRAKLADLGLVRDIGHDGDRAGTAAFMAPEQLRGAPVDWRSDLYALGCTAYAALAGQPPFRGSVKELARAQQVEAPPPFAPELRLPPALDHLIRGRLLAKDPGQRPEAAQVAAELSALAEAPFPAPRSGARRSGRSPRRSGGGGLLLGVVVLVAALAALAIYAVRFRN